MNRIRERRRALSLTMKQLASAIGVSEGAISHYETGRREPDPDTLVRIASVLGVTVDYLLGRDEAPAPLSLDLGHGETKTAPADMRTEAKRLLESMTDEQYQAALQYLKFLQSQEKQS